MPSHVTISLTPNEKSYREGMIPAVVRQIQFQLVLVQPLQVK
jgi:hypothetical protein